MIFCWCIHAFHKPFWMFMRNQNTNKQHYPIELIVMNECALLEVQPQCALPIVQ
jgi:hypothetical protein